MSCPHNLANNRQTRMLANLTLVGCYDISVMPNSAERDRLLLRSAKENLRQMAFFGLTEQQAEMRYLFEQTFGIKFRRDFSQFADTHASKVELTPDQLNSLRSLNRLDIELYEYATQLFSARVKRFLSQTHSSTVLNTHMSISNQDVLGRDSESDDLRQVQTVTR